MLVASGSHSVDIRSGRSIPTLANPLESAQSGDCRTAILPIQTTIRRLGHRGEHFMSWRIKPLEEILATAEKKSLHRSLGAFSLTMLGIGAIIGTGIFV